MLGQLMQVMQMACMFPLNSSIYMMAPESDTAKFMKKPFVKFISHSASYFMFLSMSSSVQFVMSLAIKQFLNIFSVFGCSISTN
jgi:hypothetical protein